MKAVVRQSKYRHLFGTPGQSDELYRGVRIGSGISAESTVLKANASYFAFPWAITGTICVVPLTGKPSAIADEPPLYSHEGQTVADMAFNPFNSSHLATAANDGILRIFEIPAGASSGKSATDAVTTIQASTKRLLSVEYHPIADGVILATSGDNDVKLFDIASGQAKSNVAGLHKGVVTSTAFSNDGALIVTTCKDKTLRVIDPRAAKEAASTPDHVGAKSSRAVWLRVADKILTAGFTKTAEREMALFDPRKMNGRLCTVAVDASSAAPMIFQDEDLGVVYLTGKGEGNIRLYEVEDASLHPLTEFKSNAPASGMTLLAAEPEAVLPKECCNRNKCEVLRFLKLSPQFVTPLRFEVPRQHTTYQDDLYPPTWDGKPALSASDWFSGASKPYNRASLAPTQP